MVMDMHYLLILDYPKKELMMKNLIDPFVDLLPTYLQKSCLDKVTIEWQIGMD
jgi:hypothetical protein